MEIAPILSAYDVDIVVDFAITRVSCGKLLSSCSHLVSYTAPVKIVGVKGLVLRVFSKGRERERGRESLAFDGIATKFVERRGKEAEEETRNWIWFGFHRSRERMISTIEGAQRERERPR